MLLPGKVVLVDDSGKANVELRSETSVEARGDHTAQRAISSRSNVFKCHARCASSWQSQPAKCVICEVCFGFGWRVQRCCIERCCDKTCEWVDSDRPRESRGTTYTVSIRFIDLLEASWSCLMLKDVERCWKDSKSREVVRGIPQNALIGVQLEHLLLQALFSGVLCRICHVVRYRSLMDCLWSVPFGDHNLQGSLHLNRSRALTQMGQQQEAAQDTACAHIGSRFLRDPCVGSSVARKYKGDQRW